MYLLVSLSMIRTRVNGKNLYMNIIDRNYVHTVLLRDEAKEKVGPKIKIPLYSED